MSELMKKPLIKKLGVTIEGKKERVFALPPEKARAVLTLIKDYEVDSNESISAELVFQNLLEKYGKVGAAIRGSRHKENLTQAELAKKAKIPQQHISEIENGKRSIGVAIAKKLAKVFNCDYRIFL